MKHLTKKLICHFHQDQLARYGGSDGIRDENLLESALGQAQASFGGKYLCRDIFEMAAAYGYHICMDHAFVDGNKRLTLISMYTFLYVNGWKLIADPADMYTIIMKLVNHQIKKEELAGFLRKNCEKTDIAPALTA